MDNFDASLEKVAQAAAYPAAQPPVKSAMIEPLKAKVTKVVT